MELLKRIQELLKAKDVTADFDGDGELWFSARTGPISVRIRITIPDSCVIVCAHIPVFAPALRRPPMYEAISRANWQLRFARLEMDSSDGELRCRSDMPLLDATPTDQQLTRLIFSVWSVSEQYALALVEVMTGQVEPAMAIARAEQPKFELTRETQSADLTVN